MIRLIAIIPLLLAAAAPAQQNTAPITLLADTILVPLAINGVGPYPFLLDLAAPGPIIDSEVAKFLKLPNLPNVRATRQSTSGKQIAATAAQITTLQAGPAAARNLTATVAGLRTFKRRLGSPVAGIISGREFGPNLRIDFAAATIDFSKPEPPLATTDTGVVPFEPNGAGTPILNATLDGQHVHPFAIDTTLAATIAAPETMLRRLGLITGATPRLELDAPPTGQTHPGQTQLRIKSIRVGPAEIRDPICALDIDGHTPRIGAGFLRRFRLTIDYDTKLLRIEPIDPTQTMRDPPLHSYGLGLWRFNGDARARYWTIWVAKNSPAQKAGLLSGGILTAIDGKDLKEMPHDAIDALLQPQQNTKITLSVLQGDHTHTVELVPENLL